MADRLEVSGRVRVWLDGKLIASGNNLITDLGKALFAGLVADNTGTRPSHMAIGSSGTAAAESQTALLGTEHQREALDSTTAVGSSVTYTATFTAAGAQTVQEYGLFNAAVAGTMIARFLSSPAEMGVDSTLVVSWTVSFGEDL